MKYEKKNVLNNLYSKNDKKRKFLWIFCRKEKKIVYTSTKAFRIKFSWRHFVFVYSLLPASRFCCIFCFLILSFIGYYSVVESSNFQFSSNLKSFYIIMLSKTVENIVPAMNGYHSVLPFIVIIFLLSWIFHIIWLEFIRSIHWKI